MESSGASRSDELPIGSRSKKHLWLLDARKRQLLYMNLAPPALHQIQQLTPRQNHVVETKEDKARPSLPTSAVVNLDLCVQYVWRS